uniref:Uncharacterized protein n=1 Tax=Polytomella parva TaxID=51329 RepID=A0A7S0YIE0_9CHLO|mmetsp:Transcript_28365/g.52231  ORF Transcript_28365/g.52231 Transcript_28365/m.52231 type:complete len:308 (+) Transcript_28365:138-1061(+)|eukprot:CAMPEP_0175045790 /NCGR_PEP_ID=MMETSP0052_2-20121109/4647_1 /TAXON_ID=51329 ORGANISM="Polytomella parva, Strain SAG 63-3" /NCGR_SAMPLE_ID=MMETSP0052_2 /ASSEMBLY_ACC=CAM_ASM_000194 /LENGTH=307 /DNA_ID=CAMNT_0016309417 /DNA_START=117 /DNA_END=1040 /DNA_ORIENTATION=+
MEEGGKDPEKEPQDVIKSLEGKTIQLQCIVDAKEREIEILKRRIAEWGMEDSAPEIVKGNTKSASDDIDKDRQSIFSRLMMDPSTSSPHTDSHSKPKTLSDTTVSTLRLNVDQHNDVLMSLSNRVTDLEQMIRSIKENVETIKNEGNANALNSVNPTQSLGETQVSETKSSLNGLNNIINRGTVSVSFIENETKFVRIPLSIIPSCRFKYTLLNTIIYRTGKYLLHSSVEKITDPVIMAHNDTYPMNASGIILLPYDADSVEALIKKWKEDKITNDTKGMCNIPTLSQDALKYCTDNYSSGEKIINL